jgi:hypothetical protein
MGALLRKFAAGNPMKREEAEAADRMLRANVIRVGANDLVVINAFYWNRYEKFRNIVGSEYLGT